MISITKEQKNDFCSIFFNNQVKSKHLKTFESKTPGGNIICGVICQKPNEFLGSMVITHVKTSTQEFDTLQFIHAMPKIHYYSHDNELFQDAQMKIYYAYEKLDGSCLIIYPLYDNDNNLLEIIPKTRGVPVADSFILNMFQMIDTTNIKTFFSQEKNFVLLFEMYGVLNQHEIFYHDAYINIKLIGAAKNGKLCSTEHISYIADIYHFERPKTLFEIIYYKNQWTFSVKIDTHPYSAYLLHDDMQYPTQMDLITGIKDTLTKLNKSFYANNQRSLCEGVVIYGLDVNEKPMYLKIKPWDIEEKCRTENGIPRRFIIKEMNKYFDEYGSQAKEIYQTNKFHYYDYVERGLAEEFSEAALKHPQTIKRIERVFFNTLEAKSIPIGIQKICDDLVKEYPNYNVEDLMRIFAQKYPEKKNQASKVFTILQKKVR